MQKTECRTKALEAAKSKMDKERDRGRKTKTDVVTKIVMEEIFNPFIDQARHYLRYLAKKLLRHLGFKSNPVVGIA